MRSTTIATLEYFLNHYFKNYGRFTIVKRDDGYHLFQSGGGDGPPVHVLRLLDPPKEHNKQIAEYLDAVTENISMALKTAP